MTTYPEFCTYLYRVIRTRRGAGPGLLLNAWLLAKVIQSALTTMITPLFQN